MNGRTPRYQEIALTLKERIRDSAFEPGHRLDTQRQLAREFGVTLMTLRQALDLLERDGLITRRHGRGTFVASPTIDYDILQLRAFAGDLTARGDKVDTKILRTRFVRSDQRAAQALGLSSGSVVFALERLRLVERRPTSYQWSLLPAEIGREVARADLALHSLRYILRFKLGIEVTNARETVSAVRLGSREAGVLECRAGAPAFRSERVSFAADGRSIVFDRVFIPGDRFRITREIHFEGRDAAGGAGDQGAR